MKNTFLIVIILFFLFKINIYPDVSTLNNFIKDYSSVSSIKGTIVQYLYIDGAVEKMSGEYSAAAEGLFRIDYTEPEKQIVICNRKGLYWFFPDRNLVFTALKDSRNSEVLSLLPGSSLAEDFNNVNIMYKGVSFYGLLKYAHVYSIETSKGGNSVIIWFEPGRKYVLRKYIIDHSGREIMKEIYHEHFYTGKTYIPSKIELFARSLHGMIHTRTEYSNFAVNCSSDKMMFEFVIKNNMNVRKFDEYK